MTVSCALESFTSHFKAARQVLSPLAPAEATASHLDRRGSRREQLLAQLRGDGGNG